MREPAKTNLYWRVAAGLFCLLLTAACSYALPAGYAFAQAGPNEQRVNLSKIISLDLNATSCSNFLRIVAEVVDMNIIQMDDYCPKVSIRVLDRPAESVLDMVLKQYGMTKRIDGNVIKIYSLKNSALASPETRKSYKGRLISLDLQDTDIDNALRIITKVANLPLLGEDLLPDGAKVTLRLIDVPWDQVLAVILERHALKGEISGEAIYLSKG